MLEGKGVVSATTKEPSRKFVSEWLVHVYESIPLQTVGNAWIKMGYRQIYMRMVKCTPCTKSGKTTSEAFLSVYMTKLAHCGKQGIKHLILNVEKSDFEFSKTHNFFVEV